MRNLLPFSTLVPAFILLLVTGNVFSEKNTNTCNQCEKIGGEEQCTEKPAGSKWCRVDTWHKCDPKKGWWDTKKPCKPKSTQTLPSVPDYRP